MFDPERLLKQMVAGKLGGGLGGHHKYGKKKHSKHSGGLGGMLGGSGIGKAQVGLGVLGIAMAAYEHYKQGQQSGTTTGQPPVSAPPPPPGPISTAPPLGGAAVPPPPPPSPTATAAAPALRAPQREAALLLRAMIAAAAADGRIDPIERTSIVERARAAGDDADTLAWLEAELASPVSLDELVAQTPGSLAEQVYAASLLAIELDNQSELQYLQRLGTALGIDEARRQALEEQLGA